MVLEQEDIYVRVRPLGKGAFGEAVLYRKNEDNSLVVWKEIELSRLSDRGRKDVQTEIEILALLHHSNIVAYYNHYLTESMLYIEMEYVNGGSLAHKIMNQEGHGLFKDEIVRWYCFQTLSAVNYIHLRGIIHRDIKTLNIFMNKNDILKMGDFGMSKVLGGNAMADTVLGTPYYMSPELMQAQEYNSKSDIWALGCVFYEILTLHKTFQATNMLRMAHQIITGKFDPIDPSYDVQFNELLEKCLQQKPEDRFSACELIDLPIFSEKYNEFMTKIAHCTGSDCRPTSAGSRPTTADTNETSMSVPVVASASTEVYCWGGGKTKPQKVEAFTGGASAIRTSVGGSHAAVITVEKELFTWSITQQQASQNSSGQLGHGDTAVYKQPRLVKAFVGMGISLVTCGSDFTICLSESGKLYSFGANYNGCLGLGEEVDQTNVPVKLEIEDELFQNVKCGEQHVIALSTMGTVYTWGSGEFGRLGTGSEDDAFVPQKIDLNIKQEIKDIACSTEGSFILTESGKVMACGSNEDNRLGLSQRITGITQLDISYDIPYNETFTLVKSLAKHRIAKIAGGASHSAVIDGKLITFGSNNLGQLGVGDTKPRKSPCLVKGSLSGKKVAIVTCGDGFTVACTLDKQVFVWGSTENGRLGLELNSSSNVSRVALPKPIFGTLHKVKDISAYGWTTLMVAEQTLSQTTLRPQTPGTSLSTLSGLTPDASLNTSSEFVLKDLTPQNSNPKSSNDAQAGAIRASDSSSDMPAWLLEDFEDAEVIPTATKNIKAKSVVIPEDINVEVDLGDSSANKIVSHLRARIRALEVENSELRQAMAGQTKEITNLKEQLDHQNEETTFDV